MESLKIVLANPDLVHPRGAQKQILHLAREWQSVGHEVTVAVGERAKPYQFDELMKGLAVSESGPWTLKRSPGFRPGAGFFDVALLLKNQKRMAAEIRKLKPDVLNAHNHPAQWLAHALPEIPTVWTCNEPPPWYYFPTKLTARDEICRRLDSRSRSVRAITALDQTMTTLIRSVYPGIPVHCTGSGCDLPPLPARQEQPAVTIVSVLGSLSLQKRPADVVRAVAGIPNLNLHIVGTGSDAEVAALDRLAHSLGVSLHLCGQLSEKELLSLYADCDAGVFVPENQPWGIFPLECILAGIPCVVSNEVGSTSALPFDYPWIVPVGDAKVAGDALRRALRANRPKIVEDSAQSLRDNFSWKSCAEKVLQVLKSSMDTESQT